MLDHVYEYMDHRAGIRSSLFEEMDLLFHRLKTSEEYIFTSVFVDTLELMCPSNDQ